MKKEKQQRLLQNKLRIKLDLLYNHQIHCQQFQKRYVLKY